MTYIPTVHELRIALQRHLPAAVDLRRELHADPRVGGTEAETAEKLAALLGRPSAPSIADGRILRFGPDEGPAVALRAELDALPIVEETNVSWASSNGAMHACGHDVHMAALYATILTLRDAAPGLPVVALLQPREEVYPCGAVDLLAAREWQEANIGAVIGAHTQPRLAAGHVSAAEGPVNASADEFEIRITGHGGHAAYPHLLKDPVVASAAVVGAIQQIVSRTADPMTPAVVSIGSIHGGSSANVIPDEVVLRGTARSFSSKQRTQILTLIGTITQSVSAGYGCSSQVIISDGEPVLDNDKALIHGAKQMLYELGNDMDTELRSCGADDFAYYCEVVPSAMIFVGVGTGAANEPGLHHSKFLPPDEAVGHVAEALLAGFVSAQQNLTIPQEVDDLLSLNREIP
ncbi:M20 family metallopeptidase [Paenarthrobacter sp. NPDC090517]|uniref:M20 metallopeptidase family protein n=1 Tax=Paenarthrobacter sp. NPDC090517 TaxID=3364381 RepID=UPI0037F53D38